MITIVVEQQIGKRRHCDRFYNHSTTTTIARWRFGIHIVVVIVVVVITIAVGIGAGKDALTESTEGDSSIQLTRIDGTKILWIRIGIMIVCVRLLLLLLLCVLGQL